MKFTAIIFGCILAAAPVWAQTYNVRPQYREGYEHRFENETTITFSADALPNSIETKFGHDIVERVLDLQPDGKVVLQIQIDNFELSEHLHVATGMDLRALVGKPMRVVLAANGVPETLDPPAKLSQAEQGVFTYFKQLYLMDSTRSYFPEKEVAVGDVWQKEIPYGMDMPFGTVDVLMDVEGKLEGLEEVEGVPAYRISFKGTFEGTMNEGADGTFSGSLEGWTLIDRENGLEIRTVWKSYQKTMRLTAEGEMEMNINYDYRRDRTETANIR